MRKLTLNDYNRLRDYVEADNFNSIKALYFRLRTIKEEVIEQSIQLAPYDLIYNNLDEFYTWVSQNFPDLLKDIKKNEISVILNDEERFPRFKRTLIHPQDLSRLKPKLMKKLEIWNDLVAIKQNYQQIEEISFDGEILTLFLENRSFLQVLKPQGIYNSDFSLQIKYSPKIVLSIGNKKITEYSITDNYNLKITSNKGNVIYKDCSSIFFNSLEIFK
ncbi:MAG: hypothetical protein V4560_11865 [Bacteroidota bacterium]